MEFSSKRKSRNLAKKMPLISSASQTINYLSKHADIIVVSNTPFTALYKDWSNYNIKDVASMVCGQETGSKDIDHFGSRSK